MRTEGSASPHPEKVNKPRRLSDPYRPIVAVCRDSRRFMVETGEVFPLDRLLPYLRTHPSSYIACRNASALVKDLDRTVGDDPAWQYALSDISTTPRQLNGTFKRKRRQGTVVHFVGWQGKVEGKRNGANLYHCPIDPHIFMGLTGGYDFATLSTLPGLMQWARDIRSWCCDNEVKWSPTRGGIAGQLLRDPRFWPAERRKVPAATNNRLRDRLPGNYYRLHGDEKRTYQGIYLDMVRAHHTIAASTPFPHPDTLRAKGHFRHVPVVTDVTIPEGRSWARPSDGLFERLMADFVGVLYCQVSARKLPAHTFPIPAAERPGTQMRWVYTCEIPTLRALGVSIDFVQAGWGSWDRDPGMGRYAQFALAELDAADAERRAWLKSTLLAGYGVLASRPVIFNRGYKRAKGGTLQRYPAGSGFLLGWEHRSETERESVVTNVLYRGIIEAEQRVRVLDYARELTSQGFSVLAVYADSLIIEDTPGLQLPFIRSGWEVEGRLSDLVFYDPTHWQAREMSKLPGIPRELAEREGRLRTIRALSSGTS